MCIYHDALQLAVQGPRRSSARGAKSDNMCACVSAMYVSCVLCVCFSVVRFCFAFSSSATYIYHDALQIVVQGPRRSSACGAKSDNMCARMSRVLFIECILCAARVVFVWCESSGLCTLARKQHFGRNPPLARTTALFSPLCPRPYSGAVQPAVLCSAIAPTCSDALQLGWKSYLWCFSASFTCLCSNRFKR